MYPLEKKTMCMDSKYISKEILRDISDTYSSDEILDNIGMLPYDLALLLAEEIKENISKFDHRPLDAYTNDI
jgi:hypothetical protein